MPLPPEVLADIKDRIDKIKERIASVEDILADLRASGIDALKREEELRDLREQLRKWETFYGLQEGRAAS